MRARFLVYIAVCALLLLCLVGYSFLRQRAAWQEVEASIHQIQLAHRAKQVRQAGNSALRRAMMGGDSQRFSALSCLIFLAKEREALEHLFAGHAFTGNEAAERRYGFINGSENQLSFIEGSSQDVEGVWECELSLAHPVEVDVDDIKSLLHLVEGREEAPQLLFTDWRLLRKETGLGSEVYELNLKLLKREFHP